MERERERERGRGEREGGERDRKRQRDRETERQKETERQRDRERERGGERESYLHTHTHTQYSNLLLLVRMSHHSPKQATQTTDCRAVAMATRSHTSYTALGTTRYHIWKQWAGLRDPLSSFV